ncbi:M14 family metallopeptidase [Rufibacter sp. LB8]|uniref:M14 family metallopeptidase n=1 Tax=Rufibacter sp. LB8 TaxID=2777781 RepID=UPI00178C1C5B|nr:M14 family metallopeptidase [Rufibacter sp. LB8]
MRKLSFVCAFVFWCLALPASAQTNLSYYLPGGVTYDAKIPTPKQVLGYEVGEWHVTHDQLVHYMRTVDAASDRITLQEYGRTHENRPLLLLTITSGQSHSQITQLKEQHRQLTDPANSGKLDISTMPAVVWMGYSVHGNEPSGTNASLLAIYHLAAAQGPEIEKLLKETIVLMDPSINPDGMQRFSTWVNANRGENLVSDPNSREFSETWPGGRTNHYWFDLNRDWLPLQHPESRGRLAKFHEWKPNLLTDHHEMGTNATFFFQPGIPSRNHPLTPANTFKLTQKVGTFHAKALDKIGSFYYTEESYDDFYYGKGSTYPDVNGAVGILFEQASSRGHAQESANGLLTFPFTIRNQFTTTLSTLEAAVSMRQELLEHQRTFYKEAVKEAGKDGVKAIVFGSPEDAMRTFHLAEIMHQHQIQLYRPKQNLKVGNMTYTPENAYVVPLEQAQYKLIQAMFEKRTKFQDSLFYDISAWTFPLAFDLDYAQLKNTQLLGSKVEQVTRPTGTVSGGQSTYAYALEWTGYYAPRALHKLQQLGVQTRVATNTFSGPEGKRFAPGTILIPVTGQTLSPELLFARLQTIAQEDGVSIYNMATGLSAQGVKLGSPTLLALQTPKIAMLVEGGVNYLDAGEIWHLLDNRFDMKVTLLTQDRFNRTSIQKYNTLIMPDGTFNELTPAAREKLRAWVQGGGTIVATGMAVKWLADNKLGDFNFKAEAAEKNPTRQLPYADLENNRGAQEIGGAIFETRLDITHPLGFGYSKPQLSIFRNTNLFLERSANPYANPVMYTANPLQAGYISKQNYEKIKSSAAIGVSALGSGRVIGIVDNPNFRAFWYGTNKLFLNSIFFGGIINPNSAR